MMAFFATLLAATPPACAPPTRWVAPPLDPQAEPAPSPAPYTAPDGLACDAFGFCRYAPLFAEGERVIGVSSPPGADAWVLFDSGRVALWSGARYARVWDVAKTPHAIWASGRGDAWITGDDGAWRYDAAARHWEQKSKAGLASVWGAASDDVWLACLGGVLHWNGRVLEASEGECKEGEPAVGLKGGAAIWGTGRADVWRVAGREIRHFDGHRWSSSFQDDRGGFDFVGGSGPADVWAGAAPRLFHWNGRTWAPFEGEDAAPGQVTASLRGPGGTWFATRGGAGIWDGAHWKHDVDATLGGVAPIGFVRSASGEWLLVAEDGGLHAWSKKGVQPRAGAWAGAWTSVGGTGPSDVWVADTTGATLHFDGSGWRPGAAPQAYALAGAPGGALWALASVGDRGASLLRWERGRWSVMACPDCAVGELSRLRSFTARDAWAVGARGTVARWNGACWSELSTSTDARLNDVWASSRDDAWAVGKKGALLHWDGHAWKDAGAGVSVNLEGVSGTAANDVWAVGAKGTALHWDGSAWKSTAVGADALNAVLAVSATEVWVADAGSHLWRYDGTEWKSEAIPASGRAFFRDPRGTLWLVGEKGLMLQRKGMR